MPDSIRDLIEEIVLEKFWYIFPQYGQVIEVVDDNSGGVYVTIPSLGWETRDMAKLCYPSQTHQQITPIKEEWVIVRFSGLEDEIGRYEGIASELKNMIPEAYTGPKKPVIYQDPETKDYILYDKENKTLDVKITGDLTINIEGDAKINATNIDLNGSSKKLVTFAELKTAIEGQNTDLSGKFASIQGAIGVPPVSAVTTNIDAAETSTIRTGG